MEELRNIKNLLLSINEYENVNIDDSYFEDLDKIAITLKETQSELEDIKNAISEGAVVSSWFKSYAENQDKKVLDIIKNKVVDVYGIKNSQDVYDYNSGIENEDNFENRSLTEKEYKILKGVLK